MPSWRADPLDVGGRLPPSRPATGLCREGQAGSSGQHGRTEDEHYSGDLPGAGSWPAT